MRCCRSIRPSAAAPGLGLALAREIAEAHGGRIALANREGGGLIAVRAVVAGREGMTAAAGAFPPQARCYDSAAGSASMAADNIQIPGYEILRLLGSGGMSTVYLALQRSLDRKVAIKIMRRSGDQASADARQIERRFLLEGRMMAKLPHRNIVAVYDIVSDDNHRLYRDGVSRRRRADRAHAQRPRAGRCGVGDRADRRRARIRAQPRRRASRPEAGQHHVPRQRHAGADRFRHRPLSGRIGDEPDPDRHAGRHADLHESGADQRHCRSMAAPISTASVYFFTNC